MYVYTRSFIYGGSGWLHSDSFSTIDSWGKHLLADFLNIGHAVLFVYIVLYNK